MVLFITAIITYFPLSGRDPQTKGWVDHYACVVETDLATQHWSGKSEVEKLCLVYPACRAYVTWPAKIDHVSAKNRRF